MPGSGSLNRILRFRCLDLHLCSRNRPSFLLEPHRQFEIGAKTDANKGTYFAHLAAYAGVIMRGEMAEQVGAICFRTGAKQVEPSGPKADDGTEENLQFA